MTRLELNPYVQWESFSSLSFISNYFFHLHAFALTSISTQNTAEYIFFQKRHSATIWGEAEGSRSVQVNKIMGKFRAGMGKLFLISTYTVGVSAGQRVLLFFCDALCLQVGHLSVKVKNSPFVQHLTPKSL